MVDEILNRLDVIEGHLEQLLRLHSPTPETDWLSSSDFCRLVGLKDAKALSYLLSKGVIHGDAIRNTGTVTRPRYRFHRVKAADQFLNRSPAPTRRGAA